MVWGAVGVGRRGSFSEELVVCGFVAVVETSEGLVVCEVVAVVRTSEGLTACRVVVPLQACGGNGEEGAVPESVGASGWGAE